MDLILELKNPKFFLKKYKKVFQCRYFVKKCEKFRKKRGEARKCTR